MLVAAIHMQWSLFLMICLCERTLISTTFIHTQYCRHRKFQTMLSLMIDYMIKIGVCWLIIEKMSKRLIKLINSITNWVTFSQVQKSESNSAAPAFNFRHLYKFVQFSIAHSSLLNNEKSKKATFGSNSITLNCLFLLFWTHNLHKSNLSNNTPCTKCWFLRHQTSSI